MADSKKAPPNVIEKLFVILSLIKNLVIVFVLSVPEFIKCCIEICVPPKKKCIRGWTALVTGGGNGLGKLIAENLAKEGCNVAIIDIDGNAARETAESLKTYNIKASGYLVDVANAKSVEKIKDRIEKDIGPVDLLVNNAGILALTHTFDETEEDLKRIVAINLTSSYYTTRVFLPGMMERKKGHIVTVSSAASLHPMAFGLLYTSTKYGLTAFALSLEEELRQQGLAERINSTIIYPTFIATRKELTEAIVFPFPLLDAISATKVMVEGILQNQREIYIPRLLKPMTIYSLLVPFEINGLGKTHVLKDRENYETAVRNYIKRRNFQTKLLSYYKIEE